MSSSSSTAKENMQMSHQAVVQPALDLREPESPAMTFERVLEHRRSSRAAPNSPKDASEDGARGIGSGVSHRRPLAVPRLGPGRVAPFWRMLKAPLVPLTRKEGFRCSRARDIRTEVWKRKNGRKERRFGSFAITKRTARGERQRRAVTVGTLEEYPTETAARKSSVVQAILLRLNAEQPAAADAAEFGAVIARYEQEEMPERYSTQVCVPVSHQEPHQAALGADASECRQADGGRGLAKESRSCPEDQEPRPKPNAHDFSVCGAVGTDRTRIPSNWFG